MKKSESLSNLLLLFTALIWGLSFVAQSVGIQHMGTGSYNLLRYLLACASLSVYFLFSKARFTKAYLKPSLLIGMVLFFSTCAQLFGIQSSTAGKSGFITGLYIVIVPILAVLFGSKLRFYNWLGVAMAVVGLYLLSVGGETGFGWPEVYLLIGAFGFALHIILVDRLAADLDPVLISLGQFAVAGICTIPQVLLFEDLTWPQIQEALPSLLYAGVLASALGFTLQVLGQKHSPPVLVSLILGMESVFAALGGALILKETMQPLEILGCVLMLAAVIFVQLMEAREAKLAKASPAKPEA